MLKQFDLFDYLEEKPIIDKPIRLIELFGGYGSQNLALKYLTGKSCHYKLCEWAVKSIQAYNDLHIRDYTDYSKELTDDEVIERLFELGISHDYNKSMTLSQIKQKNYRQIYNNIIVTNNLVDISRVKAKDLEIRERERYCYIMSYSFPCQDLSSAGQCKGMNKGSNTRSSLLWEVERILLECNEENCLPQILLMENVSNVHSKSNLDNFNKWQEVLKELGYKNYWQDLNAKDYGIPQSRNRTFMISILNRNKEYFFPEEIPLELKLNDLLEENVSKEYYLTDKQIEQIKGWNNAFNDPLKRMEETSKSGICPTIITKWDTNSQTILVGGIGNKKSNNGTQYYLQDRIYQGDVALNVNTSVNPNYLTNSGIRKLTARECFRLQGLKDEDIDKIMENQSIRSCIHLAGDSICVNVLVEIFRKLIE